MTPLFIFFNRYWLLTISILVILNFAAAAMANPPTSSVNTEESTQENKPRNSLAVKPSQYQSSFQHYRRFPDQEVGEWKELSDTTARVGGWREYAKQAQATDGASADARSLVVDHAKPKTHDGHSH